ncbi:prepilin peptidase [Streptomyces chartreusis]
MLLAPAAVLLAVAAALPGSGGSWPSALLGSLILGACSFVLFFLSKGIGFGDAKLALVLGAVLGWYGWASVLAGNFAGSLLSSPCTAPASCSQVGPTEGAESRSARSHSPGR